jgi:hypothetical protein
MNKLNDKDDIYNISNYTDNELFDILDLTNPTDRVLEAQIIKLINQYENIKTVEGQELYNFFNKIYNHFFEDEDENEEEENIEGSIEEQEPNLKKKMINMISMRKPNNTKVEGFEQRTTQPPTKKSSTSVVSSPVLVAPQEYTKDNLNPLLKQTTTRIISIDSQYRENKTDLPTDFTLNLSEPIKDVVSLRLYSFHIPYTWYTISNSFGSNFFILKGITDGINNGNHDYQFTINPGNYTSEELVSTVNNSIKSQFNTYTDVSFATTSITYNTNTAKSTLTIDITKNYNETNYYIDFPTWTNPVIESSNNSFTTIPSFMGFNKQIYSPYSIYSSRYLPSIVSSYSQDTNIPYFQIGINSNTFQIIQYQTVINSVGGTQEYIDISNNNNIIVNTYTINLNLVLGQKYSRNQLVSTVNNQLKNNIYIEPISSINRYDISFNTTTTTSYFQLDIKLNRYKTVSSLEHLKTVVIFPSETDVSNNIWVGTNSCFEFISYINELNNIISENPIKESGFTFSSTPQLYFKCINPNYNIPINDISVAVIPPPNTITGYTLTQYINAINNGFITTNNQTTTPLDPDGVFYINNTYCSINSTSIAEFHIDINKKITRDKFTLNFAGSFVSNLDFSYNTIDLSNTNTFSSSFPVNGAGYTLDGNTPCLTFNVNNEYINTNNTPNPINIYMSGTYDLIGLQQEINNVFNNYSLNNILLNGSVITFTTDIDNNIINSDLTINIAQILTQNDYELDFIDTASNGHWNITNSWYKFLYISDYSNNLIDFSINNITYAVLTGSGPVYGSTINIIDNSNNIFYIDPIYNSIGGAYMNNGVNNLSYEIPIGTYTILELFNIINIKFSNNPVTNGSIIETYTDYTTNNNYTKIRLNINKKYTANDYELVFYDNTSFVRCFTGSNSVQNVTWDNTLGWILGYRNYTVYQLSNYDTSGNIITLLGDTTVSVNLFNYLLIIIDDYNQSHLNDGLTTITGTDNNIPLPSYADRMGYVCNPVTKQLTVASSSAPGSLEASGTNTLNYNKLTQAKIYSSNQILNSINTPQSNLYSSGPQLTNVFAIVPLKVSSMTPGQVYSDFGGSLQQQMRNYFGPVNLKRLSIKLASDKGTVVDLNNSNWSFSFLVEQIYQQKKI